MNPVEFHLADAAITPYEVIAGEKVKFPGMEYDFRVRFIDTGAAEVKEIEPVEVVLDKEITILGPA